MSYRDRGALSLAAGDTTSAGLGDLNATFLADVPPIAIGILGFAVAKLFFYFNALNRPVILTLLSVLAGFLAVTFDLFRIYQAPNDPRDQSTRSLLVIREILLATSIFIRYLFYLEYASRWPDSTTTVDNLTVRWWDWPILRIISEGLLFFIAFIMYVLQLVWRLDDNDRVYTANVVLQLCWTTVIMLKMGYSIIVFPEPSLRWRFAKLVLPVMAALLIEWGVSVGNAIMHDFADCSAGRFLQAVEVYIIIIALMGISISHLVSQGPLSTLPSPPADKRPSRFAKLVISKPILPAGLSRLGFRHAPRAAPRPPVDIEGQQPASSPPRGRLSAWLTARLDRSRSTSTTGGRPRITLDDTPIGTPEINQWRGRYIPTPPPDMAPLPPRIAITVRRPTEELLSSTDLSREILRRSYVPPPTPPPSVPLPIPPPRAVSKRPLDSFSALQVSITGQSPDRAVSRTSTFGYQTEPSTDSDSSGPKTAADPALPSRKRVSFADSDTDMVATTKRDRRSSAPILSLIPSTSVRSVRALSIPPDSGVMTQSIAQLLREQDALEEAYATRSPRHSMVSSNEGGSSEENMVSSEPQSQPRETQAVTSPTRRVSAAAESVATSPSVKDFAARNSTRSTFSLSKFPQPPAVGPRGDFAPTAFLRPTTVSPTSRFSVSSSEAGEAHPPRPPSKDFSRPRLTVDTTMQPSSQPKRPSITSLGLPANPRSLRGTAWDVKSFLNSTVARVAIAGSSQSFVPSAPPPSIVTPPAPPPAVTVGSKPISLPSPLIARPVRQNRNVARTQQTPTTPKLGLGLMTTTSSVQRPRSTFSVMSDDEPGLTTSATRARRISRVRFVETPPLQPQPRPPRPQSQQRPPSTKSRTSRQMRSSLVGTGEADADIDEEGEGEEDDDEQAEVRLAGRAAVPLGVGTMSVATFRNGGAMGRRSGATSPVSARQF